VFVHSASMRAVVFVGKVWRELFEDFAETLPIVRAGRTKYNSGSIFNSYYECSNS
jgi:hypothetical protein